MSGFKLFEIPAAIEALTDMLVDPETGELLEQEEANAMIDDLAEERDKKIEYLCKLSKNYLAEAEALKAQKQVFEKRQKAAENRANSIKQYLRYCLAGEKWKAVDASVSVSYRNTKDTVKIDDVALLPDEFFKTPHTESNVSKTAVKEAILNGEDIPGAHLEDSVSVIIK